MGSIHARWLTIIMALSVVATTLSCDHPKQNSPEVSSKKSTTDVSENIFDIIRDENIANLDTILTSHPEVVSQQNNVGDFPLHSAIRRNFYEGVALLLRHGSDVEVSGMAYSPLQEAASCGNEKIIRAILARGAKVDRIVNGEAAIHCAVREGKLSSVKSLIEAGASLKNRNSSGETALLLAARTEQWEVLSLLLFERVDINAVDSEGRSALLYAAVNGQISIVKLLLDRGANPEQRDLRGNTVGDAVKIARCEREKKIAVIELLQRNRSQKGITTDSTKVDDGRK